MNKLLLVGLLSFLIHINVNAQTAPDFISYDCNGNYHTLYTDLEQGKIIVLCWVEPCGGCIGPSLTAYNVVQSYSSPNILFYLLDDFGDTQCSIVSGWAMNNNIGSNRTTFCNSHIVQANYGGIGMPHVVVVGSNKTIYFNELNEAAGNAAGIQAGINAALAAIGIQTTPASTFSVSLAQNPSGDKVTVLYSLSETTSVSINVINAIGEKVAYYTLGKQVTGNHEYEIDVKTFPTGSYLLLFDASTNNRVMKMLVSH